MKKILLLCDTFPHNPWFRDRLPAIKKLQNKWNIKIIDIYQFNSLQEAHAIHANKGLNFFKSENLDILNEKFYNNIINQKCNVVILGTADNYSWFVYPDTLKKIRENGIYLVGILGDDEFAYERNMYFVSLFDKVIVYVKKFVIEYNKIKDNVAYYLPNSCHLPDNFYDLQIEEREKEYDVLLVGAPFGIRPDLVNILIDAGIKISIFGSNKWLQYKKFINFYHGFIESEKFNEILQKAKIILAPLEDHITGALHMNTKIWEAVRAGQFPIATYYNFLIDDYGLVEDKDIVLYKDKIDLINKLQYYLNNVHDRIIISQNLYSIIQNNYDYFLLYDKLFYFLTNIKDEKIKSKKNEQIFITIIDISKNPIIYSGFKNVNYDRTKTLLQLIEKEIDTPYLIITNGGYDYSGYLNEIIFLMHEYFVDGRVILGNRVLKHKSYSLLNYFDIGCILWEKDALIHYLKNNKKITNIKIKNFKVFNKCYIIRRRHFTHFTKIIKKIRKIENCLGK